MHRLPTRLQLSRERRRRLRRVAAGDEPADLALVGGRVLNVFTGALSGRAIGVAEGRIAWVREEPGPAREVVDLNAATVVPGLIDAHTHVDIVCTPSAFAEAAVRFGTTAAVADTCTLSRYLPDDELAGVLTALSHASLKLLWGVSAGDTGADPALLGPDRLEALLAHPTLRRDGTDLARAVHERALPIDRLMLTGDGMLPQDLARGHMDRVVRAVVEGGVSPIDAVRMATLNPATYLGLDAHLGSIAPGRCADLLVVDDLERFSPQAVYCDGEPVARGAGRGDPVDLDTWRIPFAEADLTPERIIGACSAAPALSLRGVIARVTHDPAGPGDGPPTYLAIFLSLPALPGVALTPDGVVDVRSGGRLATSQELVYA